MSESELQTTATQSDVLLLVESSVVFPEAEWLSRVSIPEGNLDIDNISNMGDSPVTNEDLARYIISLRNQTIELEPSRIILLESVIDTDPALVPLPESTTTEVDPALITLPVSTTTEVDPALVPLPESTTTEVDPALVPLPESAIEAQMLPFEVDPTMIPLPGSDLDSDLIDIEVDPSKIPLLETDFISSFSEVDPTKVPLPESTTTDRKSTRLNSSHSGESRMPSSA